MLNTRRVCWGEGAGGGSGKGSRDGVCSEQEGKERGGDPREEMLLHVLGHGCESLGATFVGSTTCAGCYCRLW